MLARSGELTAALIWSKVSGCNRRGSLCLCLSPRLFRCPPVSFFGFVVLPLMYQMAYLICFAVSPCPKRAVAVHHILFGSSVCACLLSLPLLSFHSFESRSLSVLPIETVLTALLLSFSFSFLVRHGGVGRLLWRRFEIRQSGFHS